MEATSVLTLGERPPSWLDRVLGWLDAAPGPRWLPFVALGVLGVLFVHLSRWIDGGLAIGRLSPPLVLAAATPALFLAGADVLDRMVVEALRRLRPALEVDDETVGRIESRLTRAPRAGSLAALMLAVPVTTASMILSPASYQLMAPSGPISWAVTEVMTALAAGVVFAVMGHTIDRLGLIDQIHRRLVRVDVFRLEPLYAFATFTSWTAILFIGFTILGFIMIAGNATDLALSPVDLSGLAAVYVLAIACFVVPLLSLHQRIADEKGRRMEEAHAALAATIRMAHERIAAGNLESAAAMNDALAAANAALAAISRISTWPWRPETFRGFLGAVGLPILIWLLTTLLARLI